MARKVRIVYAGVFYHVINRGNYRSWIFGNPGARASFLQCLIQSCMAKQWRLHAWCLMGNHYHLLIETPSPDLVEGMRWLQSTFANRFNRYHKSNGHVFQGRYKAILLARDRPQFEDLFRRRGACPANWISWCTPFTHRDFLQVATPLFVWMEVAARHYRVKKWGPDPFRFPGKVCWVTLNRSLQSPTTNLILVKWAGPIQNNRS